MMNILIADDDRVQTLMLSTRLKAKGFRVAVAFDAIQAWMSAIRSPPDVIILDIRMPGGSGIAVLKQLKLSTKTSHIPVIVLTGTIDPCEAPGLKELGVTQILYKPVDLERLDLALSQFVENPLDSPSAR